ncbi:FAD-binding domain-containing protein [Dentipellis sp. KUC8613]|nr:FAD-binding domain-containing protein [Dentipellis sp. KUC8613]
MSLLVRLRTIPRRAYAPRLPRSGVARRTFSADKAPGGQAQAQAQSRGPAFLSLLAGSLGGIAVYEYLRESTPFAAKKTSTPEHAKKPQYGSDADFAKALNELRAALPEPGLVSTDEGERESYALGTAGELPGKLVPHRAVVHVRSTEDVVAVVNISREQRIPIVPYTGGTSLEGGIAGRDVGTICIDLSGMDQILEINEANADAVVQAGVSWNVLNATLEDQGIPLFFPLDPGLGATIGGMISTGCSGTNAMRYGTMRGEWVLNMTVVLPSGEVIKTRRRARKSSVGPDLGKLFIGAEGTLGIVTEVTVRLAPVLPTTVAVVQFPSLRDATEAAGEVLNLGASIQCVEFLERDFMALLANSPGLRSTAPRPVRDTLYIKIQGAPSLPSSSSASSPKKDSDDAQMLATSRLIEAVTQKHGATSYELAQDAKEAEGLWAERRAAFEFCMALAEKMGARPDGLDACVPVSKLPDLVHMAHEEFKKAGLTALIFGHVGDGNFHAVVMHRDAEELARLRVVNDRIVAKAIELDGTCTGEHGVGIRKKKYLINELGRGTVETMKLLKDTLDPLGLFNPGKLYPDDV